jgi:hypothetical protein
MSLSLYLFDLTQAALHAPLTLPQMGTLLDVLAEREPGVNPRFTELGQRLEHAAPHQTLRWLNSPAQEALTVTSALWHIELPTPQNALTVQCVASLANELGLYAYCDQIGIGFFPDQRIFPADRSGLWNEMLEADQNAPPPPSQPPLDQVVEQMTMRFTHLLAPHGFALADQTPETQRTHLRFERPIPQGRQCVDVRISEDEVGNGTMWRSCRCKLQTFHDAVSRVEMPFESLKNGPAFELSDRFFGITPRIDQSEQIDTLLRGFERRCLPLLDWMPDLAGLDQVFHAPSSDAIRGDDCQLLRDHAHPRLAGLAVAWLNGNPRFEELAQHHLRQLTTPNQKREVVERWLEALQRDTPRLYTWEDEAHWRSSHRPVPVELTSPLPEKLDVPRLHHKRVSNPLIIYTTRGPGETDQQAK